MKRYDTFIQIIVKDLIFLEKNFFIYLKKNDVI